MTEAYLQHLWHRQKIAASAFTTVEGRAVEVLYPGMWNRDAGPDFLHARIRIDGIELAGHVEIHIRSSDWYRHAHQDDPMYNAVVLHVVYEADESVRREDGSTIPEMVLRGHLDEMPYWRYEQWLQESGWIPCASEVRRWDPTKTRLWLERLAMERLERRWKVLEQELRKGMTFQQWCWQITARAFGMRVNREAFEELARRVDWKTIHFCVQKEGAVLEAVLFGAAGCLQASFDHPYEQALYALWKRWSPRLGLRAMEAAHWRFARLRPNNFPTLRLAQLCAFIRAAFPHEPYTATASLTNLQLPPFWRGHYRFGKTAGRVHNPSPGQAFILQFRINAELPLRFAAARRAGRSGAEMLEKLEEWPGEKNAIVDGFARLGFRSQCAADSQGLLQLKAEYCDERACWTCSIGQDLLTSYFEESVPEHVETDRKNSLRH